MTRTQFSTTLLGIAIFAMSSCHDGNRPAAHSFPPRQALSMVAQEDSPMPTLMPDARHTHGPRSATPDGGWPITLLEGRWEGEAWRINSRGVSRIFDRLDLSVDQHGLINATRSWKTLTGAGGHKGLTPVKMDVEQLVGVFDAYTGEFRLVEMDEPGTISGHLINPDTIEFFSTQPGRQPSTSLELLHRITAP
jgi:hypothetical protein